MIKEVVNSAGSITCSHLYSTRKAKRALNLIHSFFQNFSLAQLIFSSFHNKSFKETRGQV